MQAVNERRTMDDKRRKIAVQQSKHFLLSFVMFAAAGEQVRSGGERDVSWERKAERLQSHFHGHPAIHADTDCVTPSLHPQAWGQTGK